jgi:hypothetical protein
MPGAGAAISINEAACSDKTADPAVWRIGFTTPVGKHLAIFREAAIPPYKKAYEVNLGAVEVSIFDPEVDLVKHADEICRLMAADDTERTISTALAEDASTFLEHLAPLCRFHWQDGEFRCKLQVSDPATAAQDLYQMQRKVVSRWSRQPYVFTRRLSISLNLARILKSGNFDEHKVNFCRILVHSLPEELPFVMRGERWQKAACESTGDDARDVAAWGLTQAHKELEVLKEQVETKSKLGYLTVSIPRNTVETRDFWVTLTPGQNTGLEDEDAQQDASFCWNPFFHENQDVLYISRQIHLSPHNASCRNQALEGYAPAPNIATYIIDSVTSETEFAITNGRSKLLRLPMGEYNYEIRPYSQAIESWEPPAPQDIRHGSISWDTRRPRAKIDTW